MSAIAIRSLRIKCDLGRPNGSLDPRTNLPPAALRGADLVVQLAAFRDGVILDDVSNYESLTLLVRVVNQDGTLGTVLFSEAIAGASLTACTQNAWNAGTGQHAEITASAATMNVAEGRYRLAVYGTTVAGRIIPWCIAPFTISDAGIIDTDPPAPAEDFYTKDEADQRFQPVQPSSASVVEAAYRVKWALDGSGFLQLKDAIDGMWHSIWLNNGALQVGLGESELSDPGVEPADTSLRAWRIASDANGVFLQLKDEADATWHPVWLEDGALQIGPAA